MNGYEMTRNSKPLCAGCGEPFTAEEWADRHWNEDDIDAEYHAECCPDCVAEDTWYEDETLPAWIEATP